MKMPAHSDKKSDYTTEIIYLRDLISLLVFHGSESVPLNFPAEIIEMSGTATTYDTQSDLTERSTETNLQNIGYKRQYEDLLAELSRKKKRRSKRVETKKVKMKLEEIPEDKCLSYLPKFNLSRYCKTIIWKSIKFWHVELEKKAVSKAFKYLKITESAEKARVSDFVRTYMEDSIIMKRNNTIGSIKKLVCSTSHRKTFELPSNFKTWGEAIQEVVSARNEGVVPDQVAPATWKIFETIAFLLIPKVNGDYKSMKDFVVRKYNDTVSESDEAFVWLIMESYYSTWREETNVKAGAKKGFTATASKRRSDYETYVGLVVQSRDTDNAVLWSDRLMEVAQKLVRRNPEETGAGDTISENQSESPAVVNASQRVYLSYAARGLGESDDDSDDDSDTGPSPTEV